MFLPRKENPVISHKDIIVEPLGLIPIIIKRNSDNKLVIAAFTKAAAFSYMAFNLLCMPCFAAVGAIKKEMGNWKDTLKTIGFQMLVAWIVAFIVYIICGFIF